MIDLFYQFVTFGGQLLSWQDAFCFWFLLWLFFHIPIKIYKHFIKGGNKHVDT